MPAQRDVEKVFAGAAAAMRGLRLRWYLFGAQAVIIWGRPRLTTDVDLTVDVDLDRAEDLLKAFKKQRFRLREGDSNALVETRVLQLVHSPTGIPVDVVFGGSRLEQEFTDRVIGVKLGGTMIPVISPEDLIITKVLAGRPEDLRDVRGILRERAGSLDMTRIRELLALLEEALTRSDLLSTLAQCGSPNT